VQQLLTTAIAAGLTPRFGALTMTQTQTPSTPSTAHTQCSRTHRAALKAEEFPFTRGVHKGMYRDRLWTMRQFAGFGSADDTNAALQVPARAGQDGTKANTGLSTAFDLPTLMGRDSDDPLSAGRGRQVRRGDRHHRGHAPPLRRHPRSIGSPSARPSTARRHHLGDVPRHGQAARLRLADLGGTLQNDILKEFHAQNEFIYPPEASVKLVVDTIEFQTQHCRKWNSVSISGYHIREAGSTATAGTRLHPARRHGVRRGVPQAWSRCRRLRSSPQLLLQLHNEFFEEICKLRAARRIWATHEGTLRREERTLDVDATHVQTAGCSLTEQQPLNNIVRVAYQAMAGVLGGCQSLHTDSMDETLGLPTSRPSPSRCARSRSSPTRPASPAPSTRSAARGSSRPSPTPWRKRPRYIEEIDDMGGVVAGVNKGYFRRQIAEASHRFSQEMEAGDRLIVGVNAYVAEEEDRPCDILEISEQVEIDQCERLERFKRERDQDGVKRALDEIRKAAKADANVMPALIDGALANCTMGEMVQAMADIYGRYTGGPEW
jgi:methylmalonyl-CoA mutase N-terminal domain/subunit